MQIPHIRGYPYIAYQSGKAAARDATHNYYQSTGKAHATAECNSAAHHLPSMLISGLTLLLACRRIAFAHGGFTLILVNMV